MRTLVAYSVLAVVGVLPLLPPAAAQTVAQASAISRYTHHPGATAATRTVVLSMEGPFTFDERAKILSAAAEWNYALNGFIHFEVVAAGHGGADSWAIRAEKGGTPQAPDAVRGQPLSSTQVGFLGIGGKMLVYVDRIGTRDLRGIMLHELGHVLGLHHDRGHLMGPRYEPTTEQCIDRATIEAVAARYTLPVANLNWCDAASATK